MLFASIGTSPQMISAYLVEVLRHFRKATVAVCQKRFRCVKFLSCLQLPGEQLRVNSHPQSGSAVLSSFSGDSEITAIYQCKPIDISIVFAGIFFCQCCKWVEMMSRVAVSVCDHSLSMIGRMSLNDSFPLPCSAERHHVIFCKFKINGGTCHSRYGQCILRTVLYRCMPCNNIFLIKRRIGVDYLHPCHHILQYDL